MMAQLNAARSNVDLAKTTDAATPRYIAAQNGNAAVVTQLIAAHCSVDLACDDDG